MLPKVSIITVTYNSAATIKDTLESVAAQSYQNIEHIIIDGKSNDDTLRILQEYPHITKVVSEKDSGIYNAMNKGVQLATGDIIGILNSDDFYTNSQVISSVVEKLSQNNADGVYADLNYVNYDNTKKITRKWRSGFYKANSFLFGWMPPHPTLFVKKHVYDECGLFNESFKSAADYEFMLRIFVKHRLRFNYLSETIVHMRNGGKSNVNLNSRLNANKEDRKAWKLNDLKPYFFTLYLKPLRKICQFI
jgi:glycosyltransferase involved in cell wall biosynthesis